MRLSTSVVFTACLALLGCEVGSNESGESETGSTSSTSSTTGSETTGQETTGETTTGGEPPLENGPSGGSIMENSCAPDDGLAWEFTIALTSGCDSAQPDPDEPFVRIAVYDIAFLDAPVGTTLEWSEWQQASATYYPEGSNGEPVQASAGSFHIETWEGMPEVGTKIVGWYTLSFDAGEDIGGTFEASFCGGDPLCG